MENTTVQESADLPSTMQPLPEPESVAAPVDVQSAEAQVQAEQPAVDNVVQLKAPAPDAAPEKTIEQQISDAEQLLESLEAQRAKTAVSELECSPEVLALVAKQRASERYPRAWKEVQKHLKQVAYSGERVAYLEPTSPVFNERLVKDLVNEGFKAKIISLGANQGFKIEVKW